MLLPRTSRCARRTGEAAVPTHELRRCGDLGRFGEKYEITGSDKICDLQAARGVGGAGVYHDRAGTGLQCREALGRFGEVRCLHREEWLVPPRAGEVHGMLGGRLGHLHGWDNRLYTPREVDYFACYVVPEDIWYIFPVARLLGMSTVGLTPRLKGQKYARYMEAWGLLTRRHVCQGKRTKMPSEKMRFNAMGRLTRRIIERLEGPCY